MNKKEREGDSSEVILTAQMRDEELQLGVQDWTDLKVSQERKQEKLVSSYKWGGGGGAEGQLKGLCLGVRMLRLGDPQSQEWRWVLF